MNQEELLLEVRGGLAVATLNRPKALNALSAEMIERLAKALSGWEKDTDIKTIYIRGAGERAFCSGGDVKAVWAARGKLAEQMRYFEAEYQLDKQLFHFSKPVVAFMDGITMGGGYGIAGNCCHRVACENTVFAMPETGIGFFTDVGAAYHLSRCPGSIGRYLAVTGMTIAGADMIYAGLAEAFIAQSSESELMKRLENEDAESVIKDMAQKAEVSNLEKHRVDFDRWFSGGEVEDVLLRLEDSQIKNTIESRSPTSVRICDLYVRRAASMSFDEVIATDLRLARRFMEGSDFYEGIRAALVDKDKRPLWNPRSLLQFPPEMADSWFK